MATIVRYVNPGSSGGDGTTSALTGANAAYASLNAWEAAEQTDLDTANNIMQVNCAGTTADTTACTINGWTTSATDYIEIIGDYAVTSGVHYSTDHYRIERTATANSQILIACYEDYVKFTGIQAKFTSSSYTTLYVFYDGLATDENSQLNVNRCIFYANKTSTGTFTGCLRIDTTALETINIINSIFYGNASGDGLMLNGDNANVKNCIVYNFAIGIHNTRGNPLVMAVTNTVSFNNADDFETYLNDTITTCASDDADSGTIQPADWTTVFTDYTNFDFHLKSTDTDLKDAGTDLYGSGVTTDIDGDTISVRNDIGADEYVAAGGGEVTPYGYLSTNKGFW